MDWPECTEASQSIAFYSSGLHSNCHLNLSSQIAGVKGDIEPGGLAPLYCVASFGSSNYYGNCQRFYYIDSPIGHLYHLAVNQLVCILFIMKRVTHILT